MWVGYSNACVAKAHASAARTIKEDEWRKAPTAERDFLQGLVHIAVAWLHAARGNRPGCERQLEKAARRLGPYAPEHRGLDVADLLSQLEAAAVLVERGELALDPIEPH